MQKSIRNEIKRICDRALARRVARSKKDEEYQSKFERRTGLPFGVAPVVPLTYASRHFDPVYCKRNANFLAATIWHKARNLEYRPSPALNFEIDKPNGSKRSLMSFSFPDTAMANIVMSRIRERNLKKFSPHSFAYHPDKNLFDAVLDLRNYIVSTPLVFTVQIDFKDYFESIPVTYLLELTEDRDILATTPVERNILKQFLFHQYAKRDQYADGVFQRRTRGTPQGSSISLILANLANHALDTALEKLPGKFVRFADDVTAVCDCYEDAIKIEREFFSHCERTGIKINVEKSPGIAILGERQGALRTVSSVDYLGYSFRQDGLYLSDKTIKRVKTRLSRLIALYLIKYVRDDGFRKSRADPASPHDWDLLGLISEIRNYLYGGLSEAEIRGMLVDGRKLRKMKGLMSFYCLLDHKERLQELDGWLVTTIRRAMKKRNAILAAKYGAATAIPTKSSLLDGSWINLAAWTDDDPPETKLPSFVRGWRAARKYYFIYGLKDVRPPSYGYAYSGE